jgi:hypothetical protein
VTKALSILLALAALGCTSLRVATPEQAAALDDLDWQVERLPAEAAAPEPPPAPVSEVRP